MKIYVACSAPRRSDALRVAEFLSLQGHVVTSRWIHLVDVGYKDMDNMKRWGELAVHDQEDVEQADAVVCISGDTLTRGGRHSEFGMALITGKIAILLGPREQVFHYNPRVIKIESPDGVELSAQHLAQVEEILSGQAAIGVAV